MTGTFVAQVGGDHYAGVIQHWDVMEKYDVDYLTACATKYIARWRKKGVPKLDLGKALSYVHKSLACRPYQGARRLVPVLDVQLLIDVQGIPAADGKLMKALLCSGSREDYVETARQLEILLRELDRK